MTLDIKTLDELDAVNNKIRSLLESLKQLSDEGDAVKFFTPKQVSEMTGWNIQTTREVFNRRDFPACNFGKEKLVEIHALVKYFSVRRER